jgi:hypothetical protein
MMRPTTGVCAERIRACVLDVMDNGVYLAGMSDKSLRSFIRKYRDYFHAMLGYEPADREIVRLVRQADVISPADGARLARAEIWRASAVMEEISLRHPLPAYHGEPPRRLIPPLAN